MAQDLHPTSQPLAAASLTRSRAVGDVAASCGSVSVSLPISLPMRRRVSAFATVTWVVGRIEVLR